MKGMGISKLKLTRIPQLTELEIYDGCLNLKEIEGLADCLALVKVRLANESVKLLTFLDRYQQEIEELKRQLAEYEREETGSQVSSESSYSDLANKINQKERELEQTRNTTRRSTAPLRKEIELLKKLLGMENKVKELQEKEADWQEQLRAKEQEIQAQQERIRKLEQEKNDLASSSDTSATQTILNLRQEIETAKKKAEDLTSEKKALEEKMLGERQEALAE
jgi:chromosome segregation ATPase